MSDMLREDGRLLLKRGDSVRMDSRRGRFCSKQSKVSALHAHQWCPWPGAAP